MRRFRTSGLALVLVLVLASRLSTNGTAPFVDGPPPGLTGGFGEETCHKCHFDYDLNDASGAFRLEGIPEAYVPGQEYTIVLRLTHPKMDRGGFELAARFASGEFMGRQSGAITAPNDRAAVLVDKDSAVQYARQTRTGSAPDSKGISTWQIRWRAPDVASGPVMFHAAANAANFDDSPLGDYPYTASATSREK